MEIKTKYNVGDTVWYLSNNKVVSTTLFYGIVIRIDHHEHIDIKYRMSPGIDIGSETISEQRLFSSKEELLNSL